MSSLEERFAAWRTRPGRSTLARLLEVSESRLLSICRSILKDQQEAEEAVQESLLKIITGLNTVQDCEHYDRWSGRIAQRTALDRRRSSLRRRERESRAVRREPWTGGSEFLQDMLNQLPSEERDLVKERFFERRTFEDLARHRGLSEGAVRKRMRKIQEKLKRILGGLIILVGGAMKAKATVAIGLIPLLIVFIWIMSVTANKSTSGSTGHSVRGDTMLKRESEDTPDALEAHVGLEEPAPLEQSDAAREIFRTKLNRYRSMYKRLVELGADQRRLAEAGTWSKAIHDEVNQLEEKEMPALYRELQSLVLQYPDVCLKFFQELEWNSLKGAIGRLLTPVVQAEVAADSSKPGPILEALLPMKQGDQKDRDFLFRRLADLKSGNLLVAQACLDALEDEYDEVRYSSLHAISKFAEAGNLQHFLEENQATFEAIVRKDDKKQPQVFAYIALAGIGSESADQFILNGWLSASNERALYAMNLIASRLVPAYEQPIAARVMKAFEEPGGSQNVDLILLSLRLSAPSCQAALLSAAATAPRQEPGLGDGLMNIVKRVENGEAEAVIRELNELRLKGAVGTYAVRVVGGVDLKKMN